MTPLRQINKIINNVNIKAMRPTYSLVRQYLEMLRYLQLNFVADDCPISKGYSFFISNPPMLWLAKKNQKLITYGYLYMCQRPTLSTFFSSPNQTLLRHQYTWCQTLHQSSLLFVSFGKKSEKNMQTYCFFTRQDLQHVFNGRLFGLIPLFHQKI